jgi:hypothetical protein
MFWQDYLCWSQNNESKLFIPAKFKLEMTAKFKIKKRAGEKKKDDAVCEGRDKTTTRTHNIYYAIF